MSLIPTRSSKASSRRALYILSLTILLSTRINITFGALLKVVYYKMKIAITGASGHVGNVLCRELRSQGKAVKALVHNNEDDLQKMGVEIIEGNILDPDAVKEFCKGADIVYHLAAKISIDKKDKDLVYKTNVEGTQNIIEACKLVPGVKLIHFSTVHTYGTKNESDMLDESNPIIDFSPIYYEDSKAEAERRVLQAAEEGLNAIVLNPTAIIGPYDFQPSLLGQALIKLYNNELPMLVEGGYDFVDVRDVVAAAIQAAEKGKKGEKYILGGKWYSLKELSGIIGHVSGRKTPSVVVPGFVARIGLPFIQAYAAIAGKHPLYTAESLEILKLSSKNISNKKARMELGMSPRSIEDSLKDIFDWFEKNGMV